MTTIPTPVRIRRRAPGPGRAPRWPSGRLSAAVQAFLRSLRTRRPETRGTYERALQEFLRWAARRADLRFTVSEIRAYKRYLIHGRGLSDVSVSTYLTAVRGLCGYLHRTGALPENPARNVPGRPRPRSHARRPLSISDAMRLLESLHGADERGLRDAAMVRLMLRCALSDAEIVRLDLGDLRKQDGGWTLAVQGKGKTSKDASVELPEDVSAALRAYLLHRTGTDLREPLFLSAGNSSRGRRMTTRAVRDRVNECLEQSGVRTARTRQRVTPRSLRHTAALLMSAEGAAADEIRQRLRLGTLQTVHVYLQGPRQRAWRVTTSHHSPSGDHPRT